MFNSYRNEQRQSDPQGDVNDQETKAVKPASTATPPNLLARVGFFITGYGCYTVIKAVVGGNEFTWLSEILWGALNIVGGGLLTTMGESLSPTPDDQPARDDEAEAVKEAVLRHKPRPPFGLYLRSFSTTATLTIRRKSALLPYGVYLGGENTPEAVVELESLLAAAMRDTGTLPLVGLGLPGEHFGSGRIRTGDKNWQFLAEQLIRCAEIIFVVPGDSSGTLWELRHLKTTGRLWKVIMLMPPETADADWAVAWWNAKVACDAIGLTLPDYDKRGMFFTLGDDGRQKLGTSLPRRLTPFALLRALDPFRVALGEDAEKAGRPSGVLSP
jgi:hypothetical protein